MAPSAPLILAALGGSLLIAVLAAVMLGRAAEDHDVSSRLRRALRPVEAQPAVPPARQGSGALRLLVALGERMRNGTFLSERDAAELQRSAAAAGLDPALAVPAVLAGKAGLLVLLPAVAMLWVMVAEPETFAASVALAGSLCLAIILPNTILARLRKPFQERLRKGLPNALDLMVVAAEAGLGLESAVDRVARELAPSNPAVALEFSILVQELRMLPDRRAALERMGERTGMEGFKRFGATLAQTLRYGTPLAQALRVLAAEMRQERMLRLEEKAVRLPAMLVGPLIIFILPALFIALVGPSVLEIMRVFGSNP
jgi:tight adherence protein C